MSNQIIRTVIYCTLFSFTFFQVNAQVTTDWAACLSDPLNPSDAVAVDSGEVCTAGATDITIGWSIETDGGFTNHTNFPDFVSYDPEEFGAITGGVLHMGFDNDAEDPDDKVCLTLSFNPPLVTNLSFTLLDIDEADDATAPALDWDDAVEIYVNGNTTPVNAATLAVWDSNLGSCMMPDNETFVTGYEGVDARSDDDDPAVAGCGNRGVPDDGDEGNVTISPGAPISSITIKYFSGDDLTQDDDPNSQRIGISNLTFNEGTALPVTLTDFYGEQEGLFNRLDWVVALEVGVDYYLVQRSTDGVTFEDLGMQAAVANDVDVVSTYQYVDHQPSAGINYYRLKMVDFDGSIDYSDVIDLRNETAELIFPNPASDFLRISSEHASQIEILDLSGRIIYGAPLNGNQSLAISFLNSGTYMVRLKGGQKVSHHRLVKQ